MVKVNRYRGNLETGEDSQGTNSHSFSARSHVSDKRVSSRREVFSLQHGKHNRGPRLQIGSRYSHTLKASFVDFEEEQIHCSRYKRLTVFVPNRTVHTSECVDSVFPAIRHLYIVFIYVLYSSFMVIAETLFAGRCSLDAGR